MKQTRVLMKDVAKEAGVHQTTVSLALRNHPSLPQATRERIQKLAKDMGYRPDPALSALVAYRQATKNQPSEQVIAWIVNYADPNRLSSFHVHKRLMEGARERASELGYKIDIFWHGQEYKDSRSLNRVLRARGIQGVVFGAFEYRENPLELDWDLFSIVKVNILPKRLAFDAVLCNQIEAVRLAIEELAARGFKRIGLAVSEHEEVTKRFTFSAGYYTYRRLIPAEHRIAPCYFEKTHTREPDSVIEEVVEWARANEVEAIISNWNNIDAAALRLTEEGRSCRFVPLDADERTKPYGGINQDHHETGRRAIDMVVGQIKTFRRGLTPHPTTTLVTPSLMPLAEVWPPQPAAALATAR